MSPRALTRAELSGWLRLAGASGVPAAACAALLGAFASLEALFAASHAELAALVGDAAAQSVLAPPAADFEQRVDAALAWLDEPGNALVTRHDPAYPGPLAELYDPPPLLYIKAASRCSMRGPSRSSAAAGRRRRGSPTRRASRASCRTRAWRSCRASPAASTAPRIAAGSTAQAAPSP